MGNHDDEALLRIISRMFAKRGISVRREKLTRGSAFRVKSGNCLFNGKDIIFVDKRLPASQQVAFLIDCLVESKLQLDESELSVLPQTAQSLFPPLSSELPEPLPAAQISVAA